MFKISNTRNIRLMTLTIVLVAMIIGTFALTSCDRRAIDPNRIRITEFTTVGGKSVLYQDDGATHIMAYAQVRDQNNFAMPGQQVRFRVVNGIEQVKLFPAVVEADTTGLAHVRITVQGDALQGLDDLEVIVGAYIETRLHKELRLTLQKDPEVEMIILEPNPIRVRVNINEMILLRAIPLDSNFRPLPDGTIVHFQSDLGRFTDEENFPRMNVPVINGQAETYWNAGTLVGSTEIIASVGRAESNILATTVVPGMPSSLHFIDPPFEADVNGPSDTLRVQLADRFGNPIDNGTIHFTSLNSEEANLGTITPPTIRTNADGFATVLFTPGPISGNAIVTATCGDSARAEILIEIRSIEANFIRFTNEESIDLSIRGGGGPESSSIGVSVFDRSGNIVTEPHWIAFSIIEAPDGVTIQDQPWGTPGSPNVVYELTHGGIAYVSISAGTRIGSVILRAVLLSNDPDSPPPPAIPMTPEVGTSRANIAIHAGPPATFELVYPPGGNIFTSAGVGIWQTVIGVMVHDIYGNPVRTGTAVVFGSRNLRRNRDIYFEHMNFGANQVDTRINQDWVNVYGHAFVGNVSVNEDSAQGVAYTTLLFHGRSSNHFVDIDVFYGNAQWEMEDSTIKLWMVEPELEIQALPNFIEWVTTAQIPGTTLPPGYFRSGEAHTMLQVFVRDGQGTPINNAPILFTTNRGHFKDFSTGMLPLRDNRVSSDPEWPTEPMFEIGDPDLWSMIPASQFNTPFEAPTDANGIQRKLFYMFPGLVPPSDDPNQPGEITADIQIELTGIDNTRREITIFIRSWL